jgi:ABC-type amino acid transport substrate-binding protein
VRQRTGGPAIVGCPGIVSSGHSGGDQSGGSAAAGDACALLTTAEIGAVTNSKASNGEGRMLRADSICKWTLSSGVLDYIEVTITPTGGREKFDFYADGYYEVDPEHVSGIGDDALKTGTLPGGSFYVVSGDELLTVRFSLPMSEEDPYSVVQVLVENAASRL